jgi:AcrR family transcriptional regulator
VSTSAPRARNPRGEGRRLREEIAQAALDLLDEGGDDAVTLRAVARRVGITAPSIYAHYSGRDAILLELADAAFAELAHALEDGRHGRGDPADRLGDVCRAYLRFAREQPRRYRIMFGGVWDAGQALERGDITAEQARAVGARALDVLEAAVRDLGTSTDVTADAVVVWLGLHGLAHQRLVAPAFPWPDDIEDRLIGVLTGLDPART